MENDPFNDFDELPEEIREDSEAGGSAEPSVKSSVSRDKSKLETRRRLEELLEAKRLGADLEDYEDLVTTQDSSYEDFMNELTWRDQEE